MYAPSLPTLHLAISYLLFLTEPLCLQGSLIIQHAATQIIFEEASVPSACTLTQPANFTCRDVSSINTPIQLAAYSTCSSAQVSVRSFGNIVYSPRVGAYIFAKVEQANAFETDGKTPAYASFISGCPSTSSCDMNFSPSEVFQSQNVSSIQLVARWTTSTQGVVVTTSEPFLPIFAHYLHTHPISEMNNFNNLSFWE